MLHEMTVPLRFWIRAARIMISRPTQDARPSFSDSALDLFWASPTSSSIFCHPPQILLMDAQGLAFPATSQARTTSIYSNSVARGNPFSPSRSSASVSTKSSPISTALTQSLALVRWARRARLLSRWRCKLDPESLNTYLIC